MLPETYLNTLKDMRTYYRHMEEQTIKNTENATRAYRQSNDQYEARVTEITNKFLETGVFFLSNGWEFIPKTNRKHGEWYHTTMAVYCRGLAKSMKRPFIRLVGDHTLFVPATKRLDVLTTPLMFCSQKPEYPGHIGYGIRPGGVYEMSRYTSLREYRFHFEEGKAHLATWLEYIKSPECRKALGITTG